MARNSVIDVYKRQGEDKKETMAAQCENPVRWQKTIEHMIANGVDTFIEVGVGKTLAGLIKKINPEVTVYQIENKEGLDAAAEAVSYTHLDVYKRQVQGLVPTV